MDERCRTFRQAFLLSGTTEAAGVHDRECADCRSFVEEERRTAAMVRAGAPRPPAPARLREAVAAVFAREEARRAHAIRRRRLVLAAVCASAIAAAGAWAVVHRGDGARRAHATTDLIAEDFLKYAPVTHQSLQVESGDRGVVERFFAEEVQLATRIPRFEELALVGGRRCNLGGRRAALVFFERRGPDGAEPYALFVFEGRGESWSSMPQVRALRGRRACHDHKHGVGIIVWEERGLVYALAGAQDVEHMTRVAGGAL